VLAVATPSTVVQCRAREGVPTAVVPTAEGGGMLLERHTYCDIFVEFTFDAFRLASCVQTSLAGKD
jgi:hypothetical protein